MTGGWSADGGLRWRSTGLCLSSGVSGAGRRTCRILYAQMWCGRGRWVKNSPYEITRGSTAEEIWGFYCEMTYLPPRVEILPRSGAPPRRIRREKKKSFLCGISVLIVTSHYYIYVVVGNGSQRWDLHLWFRSRMYGDTILLNTRSRPHEEHRQPYRGTTCSAAGWSTVILRWPAVFIRFVSAWNRGPWLRLSSWYPRRNRETWIISCSTVSTSSSCCIRVSRKMRLLMLMTRRSEKVIPGRLWALDHCMKKEWSWPLKYVLLRSAYIAARFGSSGPRRFGGGIPDERGVAFSPLRRLVSRVMRSVAILSIADCAESRVLDETHWDATTLFMAWDVRTVGLNCVVYFDGAKRGRERRTASSEFSDACGALPVEWGQDASLLWSYTPYYSR